MIRLVVLLTALLPAALCQDAAAALALYPECARACIVNTFLEGFCPADDLDCVLTNEDFQASVADCVGSSCSITESLAVLNATASLSGTTPRDVSHAHVVLSIAMITLAGLFVGVRALYRTIAQTGFFLDDYLIMVCFICMIPSTYLALGGTLTHGLGRDIWTVHHNDINAVLKYFFSSVSLYFLECSLIKVSILLFYLRIFPGRVTRRVLWCTIWFTVVCGLIFIIIGSLQCRPISYFWTQWDGEHKGQCINGNRLAWCHASINIALDLWMLAIPLWELQHLQLHWKKKVSVAVMFGLGTFVTVTSIMRLESLVKFGTSLNATWEMYGISFWSTIEISVGVACACLPTVRLLLVRVFPSLTGSTHASYYQGPVGLTGRKSAHQRGGSSISAMHSESPRYTYKVVGESDGARLMPLAHLDQRRIRNV